MHLLTRPFHCKSSQYILSRLLNGKTFKIHGPPMSHQLAVKLNIVPAPPMTSKTYIQKNEDLKRELSPHLTVYKPQLTSMLSITLRMTGFALGIMTWVVGLTSLISDQNVDYFVDELKRLELNDYWWTIAKIVVVFPFAFHYVNGVRHLFFDTAKLMEIKQFYGTGYAAIGLSCVLAVLLGMLENIRDDKDKEK